LRLILAALAGWALVQGPSTAFAAKNVAACDIVAFASGAAPMAIAPEAWRSYRDAALAILGGAPDTGAAEALRDAADRLAEAQDQLLAPVTASKAYKDYLASDSCLLLKSLNPDGVEAALAELGASTPARAVETAREIANEARELVSTIARSARFRSKRDQVLLFAQYYCFAAGAIHALLSPEQQGRIGLATFGSTVTCSDAGRKE
jgi:hypothetical protein